MRNKVWFPVLSAVFFFVLIVQGTRDCTIRAMLFPYVLGAIALPLLISDILTEVKRARGRASWETRKVERANLGIYLSGIAWVLAILPVIYLLGFGVGVILYTLLCLKFNGEKWPLSIVISAISGVFFYFVFDLLLNVPFFGGLFSYIME